MLPLHCVRMVPIYIGDQRETEFKNTVVYGYLVALHIHIQYCAEVLRHFLFCFFVVVVCFYVSKVVLNNSSLGILKAFK